MKRREALRLLAAGTTLPLVPHRLFGLRQARILLGDAAAPRTLNPHQFATVKTIADMILPRTDTPGAADVSATEFLDLILTEWYTDEERSHFLNGLADVDVRARALFSRDFVDCSAVQRAEILTALGEKLLEEADAMRDQPRTGRAGRAAPPGNFYAMLRRMTLTAYYTSEAGATAELKFEMIPEHYDGCAPVAPAKEASNQP
jgi:hypothetical protein